jgi:hypothetical protein
MAPAAMLKAIPCALGSSVIMNSTQRSGLDVPQQLSFRITEGLNQVPPGFPVRLTVNVGTLGPQIWALASVKTIISRKRKVIFLIMQMVFHY